MDSQNTSLLNFVNNSYIPNSDMLNSTRSIFLPKHLVLLSCILLTSLEKAIFTHNLCPCNISIQQFGVSFIHSLLCGTHHQAFLNESRGWLSILSPLGGNSDLSSWFGNHPPTIMMKMRPTKDQLSKGVWPTHVCTYMVVCMCTCFMYAFVSIREQYRFTQHIDFTRPIDS